MVSDTKLLVPVKILSFVIFKHPRDSPLQTMDSYVKAGWINIPHYFWRLKMWEAIRLTALMRCCGMFWGIWIFPIQPHVPFDRWNHPFILLIVSYQNRMGKMESSVYIPSSPAPGAPICGPIPLTVFSRGSIFVSAVISAETKNHWFRLYITLSPSCSFGFRALTWPAKCFRKICIPCLFEYQKTLPAYS